MNVDKQRIINFGRVYILQILGFRKVRFQKWLEGYGYWFCFLVLDVVLYFMFVGNGFRLGVFIQKGFRVLEFLVLWFFLGQFGQRVMFLEQGFELGIRVIFIIGVLILVEIICLCKNQFLWKSGCNFLDCGFFLFRGIFLSVDLEVFLVYYFQVLFNFFSFRGSINYK